ncbi:hypothetical protein JTE90_010189 [Oedothorax gibbosus]|uniref:Large proline-rich protein BAG6 domain-containing protein n=1 Tax=Oedothorax gibbosus TaxID=931172 RepID=A0AAV6UID9_9ARAC|nr:hypothetical protein JTE90_010189 [Oedothorax gibbosus]
MEAILQTYLDSKMLEVTVKTLDSQNHSFTVPDETTVKEFKDHIAPVLFKSLVKIVVSLTARFCVSLGWLKPYITIFRLLPDVNGKVIHVVQSLPPLRNSGSSGASTTSSTTGGTTTGGPRNHRDAAGFLLGAFTIPQDMVDPAQVQNIVQDVVSGMGEIGRNATVMSRASDDGSVDVHINLGRVPMQVPLQSEAQLRMNRVQTMLLRANHLLDSLEDGANSNNGSAPNTSSQTESGSRSSPTEAATTGNNRAPQENPNSSETSSSSEEFPSASDVRINTEIHLGDGLAAPTGSDRFRFEGLAHAAQAAISAAFATAAATARAATATAGNTSTATPDATTPGEPMESTDEFISPVRILPTDPTVIAMDSLPSDSETTLSDPSPPMSAPSRESPSHHPDCPMSTTRTATTNTPDPIVRRGGVVQPSVQTLANLMDEVIRVNTRLQPCLERCRDMIRSDPTLTGRALGEAHRLFSRVSQLMHFLSHAYHSLSDLHINFSQAPPRSPRVRIISSTSAASSSLFQGIPIQAQISISTSNGSATGPSTTTTAPMANRDNASLGPTVSTTQRVTASGDTGSTTSTPRPVPAPRLTTQPIASPLTSISGSPSAFSFASRSSQNPVVFMEVSTPVTAGAALSSSVPLSQSATAPANVSNFLSAFPPHIMELFQGRNGFFNPSSGTPTNPMDFLHNPSAPLPPDTQPTTTPATTEPVSTRPTVTRTPTASTRASTASTGTNTSSQPTTRTTTGTQSGPPPPLGLPFRSLIPVPLTSMGSLHTFDSGLPCHSVWALEPSRRRHNAGGSRSSASSNVQAAVSPNIPGVQEDQLQQVISSIMMSLLNHPQNQAGSPVPAGFTVFTSRSDDPPREGSIFVNAQQSTRDRAARSENSVPQPAVPLHRNTACDETTLSLFDALGVTNMTISEIMPHLSFNEETLLGKILRFLADTLHFKDVLDISFGGFNSLGTIEFPLEMFFNSQIFKKENPGFSDVELVSQQIYKELESSLQFFINACDVRPNMDLKAALAEFVPRHIHKIIYAATCAPESSVRTYSEYLATVFQTAAREFLALLDEFTTDGSSLLVAWALNEFDPINIIGKAPWSRALEVWLDSSVSKFMMLFAPRRPVATEGPTSRTMRQLRSLRRAERLAEARSSSSDPPWTSRNLHTAQRASNLVEALGVNEAVAASLSASRAAPTLAAFARIAEQTTNALLRNNTRQNEGPNNLAEVVIGSEAWHSAVPSDWVPIISRDINRTRRQAPQAPFSNAYLSGMPSKRRKIMTNGNATLLEPSQGALSEMLAQAISSAGVRPTTTLDEVKEAASQDLPLQASFTDHMKHAIQERLQGDLDYCSERFPNSEKYFN